MYSPPKTFPLANRPGIPISPSLTASTPKNPGRLRLINKRYKCRGTSPPNSPCIFIFCGISATKSAGHKPGPAVMAKGLWAPSREDVRRMDMVVFIPIWLPESSGKFHFSGDMRILSTKIGPLLTAGFLYLRFCGASGVEKCTHT